MDEYAFAQISNIALLVIFGIIVAFYGIMALVALFSKKDNPLFWQRDWSKCTDVTDIRAFNRAQGKLWATIAFCFGTIGLLLFFNALANMLIMPAMLAILAMQFVGMVRIHSKYRVGQKIDKLM